MSREKFEIYRTRRSLIAQSGRLALGNEPGLKKVIRKMSDDDLARHLIASSPEAAYGLDGLVIAEELFWESEGKHIIFPQSAGFIERLLNAKFDLSVVGGFQLPFPAFMLPMPLGFTHGGTHIRGVLVTSYRLNETREIMLRYADYLQQPFNPVLSRGLAIDEQSCKRHFKVPEEAQNPVSEELKADEPLLCISLLDGNRDPVMSSTIRGSEGFSRIGDLLSASTPEEFSQRLGPMKQANYRVRGLSREDEAAEFYAFKIVCALSVYNMATNGDLLKPGFPGERAPHIEGRLDRKGSQSFTLGYGESMSEHHSAPGMHYRQWHFRQLKDKRYYQGEYKSKPVGSRWVFVRDTVVAARGADAYTLEE
jgi:hypothetical protein